MRAPRSRSHYQAMILALVSLASMLMTSCTDAAALATDPTNAGSKSRPEDSRQMVLVFDVSGSQSEKDLKAAQHLAQAIVDELSYGDRVVLLRVDSNGRTPERWIRAIRPATNASRPTGNDVRALRDMREDIRRQVRRILSQDRLRTTDLLSTLFTVSDHANESGGRPTTLVLFSDMIQDGDGINFTKDVPNRRWIEAQQAADRIPSLRRVCITVAGADPSTRLGARIRDFWREYFGSAGADFSVDRYRHTMTQFESVLCAPSSG